MSATIAAASSGRVGEVYNVAGGSQATILEIVESLGELTSEEVKVSYLPAVPGDARHTSASIDKAATELGYAPRVDLREGLSSQLAAGPRRPGT